MRKTITRSVQIEAMLMLVAALGGAVLMTLLSVASLPVTLDWRLFPGHFP